MKKLVLIRAGLLLTIGLGLISNNTFSNDSKQTRKERKEARRAELVANFQSLDTLIGRKLFVLEADYLENRYGSKVMVPQFLNFIRVNYDNAVLQTGSNINLGYNGVGGVTAEGKITRWEVVKNSKNLSYYIRFSVITNDGVYDVSMNLNSDNNAQAKITGLTYGQLIYDGHIRTIGNSSVFKGQSR